MALKRVTFEEQEVLNLLGHMNIETPQDAAMLLEYAFQMGRHSACEDDTIRIKDFEQFLNYINKKLTT